MNDDDNGDDTRTEAIYHFRAVDDTLATAGQPTEAQLGSAARDGFAVVINLALHDDPRYSLPDEAGTVRALGMEYVHIPVAFGSPTAADLSAFFDAMERHAGRKTLVHCAANMRVSAFVGLYRAIRKHEPIERAFAVMRTIWEPNPVWSEFIETMLRNAER